MERTSNLRMIRAFVRTSAVSLAALSMLSACEGETITVGASPGATPPSSAAASPTPSTPVAAAEPEAPVEPAAPVAPTYRDEDFVEAATNRDPFRNFAQMFVPVVGGGAIPVQRQVRMDSTSIDEMRLIAIVSGVPNPSAMILDTAGTGHTVHRGDYVGRPDFVSTGGAESVPITLNWRVDRISPAEVILTRDDPSAPNRMALTRVMPLHTEQEENR